MAAGADSATPPDQAVAATDMTAVAATDMTAVAATDMGAPSDMATVSDMAGARDSELGTQRDLAPLPDAGSGRDLAAPRDLGSSRGFYIFTANDNTTYATLQQTATSNTQLGLDIYNADSTLALTIGKSNTMELADSIAIATADAQKSGGAASVFYDIEHWAATPASEQQDPVGSIATAAAAVHAAGKMFGVASDGLFLGITPSACTFNLASGIVPKVNWANVDRFNMQEQELAGPNCGGSVANFASFAKQVTAMVHAQNPKIVVSAQVSLRDSSPQMAIAAIDAVKGVVDAIYVAYPAPCTYCTSSDLSTVLNAIDSLGPNP